jgi:hypothetical protein
MSATETVTTQQDANSKSDIFVGLGVVVCLALGASLTYWLNSVSAPPARTKPAVAQGTLLSAPVEKSTATPDVLSVGFDTLGAFYYEIPSADGDTVKLADPQLARPKDQIPAPVKALTGKKVAVQGFMVPVKVEKGATKQFLLVKDQSLCCFGRMPRMNEWVSVKMAGDKSARFIGDQPITVFGTLTVGEEYEKGEVLSIFRMEADDVAGPLDL